jgi:uncharacterized membrane protein YqjE
MRTDDPYPAGAVHAAPPAGDSSVGELVKQVAKDLSTLVRQEIELAKVEAKDEAKKAGKAAGMFGGAGFAGYMVAVFISLTAVAALDKAMPTWLAALIVTAVWGLVGAVLFVRARSEMRRMQGLPQTQATLKEDAQWARHPAS